MVRFQRLQRRHVQQLRNSILDDDPTHFSQLCGELGVGLNDSVWFPIRQNRGSAIGLLDTDYCTAAFPEGQSRKEDKNMPICLPIHFAIRCGSKNLIEWMVRRNELLALDVAHWQDGKSAFQMAETLPQDVRDLLLSGQSTDVKSSDSSVGEGGSFAESLRALRKLEQMQHNNLTQRVLVTDFEAALETRKKMRELQLGSGLHLVLYIVLTVYACGQAAPWSASTNAPVFLQDVFETAEFATTSFASSFNIIDASYDDIYSVQMFADWFEQILLPTVFAAQQNLWVQPDTSNVLFMFGAYVRQLRVFPQTSAPFLCGCVDPTSFFAAASQPCYSPWDESCVDTAAIDLGGGETVPFSTAQETGLVTVQGYLDQYDGSGHLFFIDDASINQALTECGANATALMGSGCGNATGSIFDRFIDEMTAQSAALRLVQVGMEFRFLDDTVSSTSVGVGESTFTKFDMFLEISAINAMETFTTITSANLLASETHVFFGILSLVLCLIWIVYTVWLALAIRTVVRQWTIVVDRGHIARIVFCVILCLLVASQSVFVLWFYAAREGQADLEAALNTSTYFEFTYLLNWHRISSILAVAAVVVCSCVLVSFLSFFKATKFVIGVIARATLRSVPALLLFLVFLISWAIAGYTYFGAAVYSFSTAGQSIASAIFFLNGYIPFDSMNAVSHVYTLFMVVAALCVVNLALYPMLTAIFIHCWVEEVEKVEGVLQVDANGDVIEPHSDSQISGASSAGTATKGNPRSPSQSRAAVFSCNQCWRSVAGLCRVRGKALKTAEWMRLYRKWRAFRTNDQRDYLTLQDLVDMTDLFGEERRPEEASTLWRELGSLRSNLVFSTRQTFAGTEGVNGIRTGRGSADTDLSFRRLGALKKLQRQIDALYSDQAKNASMLKQLLHENSKGYGTLAKQIDALAKHFPDEKLDML